MSCLHVNLVSVNAVDAPQVFNNYKTMPHTHFWLLKVSIVGFDSRSFSGHIIYFYRYRTHSWMINTLKTKSTWELFDWNRYPEQISKQLSWTILLLWYVLVTRGFSYMSVSCVCYYKKATNIYRGFVHSYMKGVALIFQLWIFFHYKTDPGILPRTWRTNIYINYFITKAARLLQGYIVNCRLIYNFNCGDINE